MRILMKRLIFLLPSLLAPCLPAHAWWPQGHSIISEAAVRALPADVPSFFRHGSPTVAHCAQDPDVDKNPGAPAVTDREAPEHFIDYELLRGQPLPLLRSDYLEMCAGLKLKPGLAGYLPYAIAEWTERLSIAFAEHRRWPLNPYIQSKCLVYAGILSHYSGDLCMPLHVTVDYDGRVRPDGSSPHNGIHARVDSLVERLDLKPAELAADQKVVPLRSSGSLMPEILLELAVSRSFIARTYELEPLLPRDEPDWKPSPDVKDFAVGRAREAARFTAAVLLTAWRRSAFIRLPKWLRREASGAGPAP